MNETFGSKADAERWVRASLTEFVDDYDVAAIVDEAIEYRVEENDAGQILQNTERFECIVDSDEYWRIVERHEIR